MAAAMAHCLTLRHSANPSMPKLLEAADMRLRSNPPKIARVGSGAGLWLHVHATAAEKKEPVTLPTKDKTSTEADGKAAREAKEAKEAKKAADWKRAASMMGRGSLHQGRVEGSNSGGLLVRFGTIQGFLPLSQLDPARFLPKEATDGSAATESNEATPRAASEVAKEMVGQALVVRITEASEDDRRLIFSEKQAIWVQKVRQLKWGEVYEGRVSSVADFGAFVEIRFRDGKFYPGVAGLVHVSELSWEPIRNPREILAVGQEVNVKVVEVDTVRMRLALSIRQLEADPLRETLDTLMPHPVSADEAGALGDTPAGGWVVDGPGESSGTEPEFSEMPLPGLEVICAELQQEEGILSVTLGRQALQKSVVSQDLELWLSNAPLEDGRFTLLARAGRQVQEVQVTTTLNREAMKAAVQQVTGRVE